MNSTVLGTLYDASLALAKAMTSSALGGCGQVRGLDDGVHPAAPLRVAEPDDHDVGDPGCSLNAASTSAGNTLAAPVTIMSDRRSAMNKKPSSSIQPRSPTVKNSSSVRAIGATLSPT